MSSKEVGDTLVVDSASPHATLKINALGLGMAIPNLAVEVDLVPHLSLALPFYYSGGYDYLKETIKFRCAIFQPEFRYYPWLKNKTNAGFYLGLHFGLGHYNFALDGDYRYQDHQGKEPAMGGGLGLGYKLRFKKNSHWGIDFAIGGGVYTTRYDLFYNENNGPYYEKGISKLWYGVDNAAISFFYEFDMKKKGGKR